MDTSKPLQKVRPEAKQSQKKGAMYYERGTMNQFSVDKLKSRLAQITIPEDDLEFLRLEIPALYTILNDPEPVGYSATSLHTQDQVGYLASLMDMERENRLDLLEILTGVTLYYDEVEDVFPGQVIIGMVPDRSSKDLRISKYMTARLIEYFGDDIDNAATKLKSVLKYASSTTARQERQRKRHTLRATKSFLKRVENTVRLVTRLERVRLRRMQKAAKINKVSSP